MITWRGLIFNSTVCSTAYSTNIKENIKPLHSLPFARGIHRSPVDSPHKGPVMWKRSHVMTSSFGLSYGDSLWTKPVWLRTRSPQPSDVCQMSSWSGSICSPISHEFLNFTQQRIVDKRSKYRIPYCLRECYTVYIRCVTLMTIGGTTTQVRYHDSNLLIGCL